MKDFPEDAISVEPGTVIRLRCLEVWGGNRRVNHAVELPGLEGWVHSEPTEDAISGGDVHYLSVCSKGILSRFTLADVSGHGQSSSAVARILRRLIHKYIDTWNQTELMRELNESLQAERGERMQYATAAFFAYLLGTRQLVFTNAGHPPALWWHAKTRAWDWLEGTTSRSTAIEGLPLGIIPGTDYIQSVVKLEQNDIVILYTDGITEASNPDGKMLGADGLMQIVRSLAIESPGVMAKTFLEVIHEYRGDVPRDDDQTFMILRHLQS